MSTTHRKRPRQPGKKPHRKATDRPRKYRHWPVLEIGSELWWRQVRRLGVQRRSVEAALDRAHTDGRETINPHHVSPDGTEAAHAVTYILLFKYVPTYGSLMYVCHAWSGAGRSLKEWIVAQYAFFIEGGSAAQREAARYSLWVDFFEVPERAKFVFPRLLKRVTNQAELLSASGPVPWAVKRSAYRDAARNPSLHAALAAGLAGSFFDVYGSVDPPEARDLFRAIEVKDDEIRAALKKITTEPNAWNVLAVITVDQRDERWTRWVRRQEPSFLVLLRGGAAGRGWVPSSDLYHEGRWIGRLVHFAFPFDPAISHQVYGQLEPSNFSDTVLFRVEGNEARVREAIGGVVEAWPPGLGPSH